MNNCISVICYSDFLSFLNTEVDSFFKIFVCVRVCVCVSVCAHACMSHICGGQRITWRSGFSPSTVRFPGMEFRWLVLEAAPLSAEPSSGPTVGLLNTLAFEVKLGVYSIKVLRCI